MLRFPDEKTLQEFLGKSHVRIVRPLAGERLQKTTVDQTKPPKQKKPPKPPKIKIEGSRLERLMIQQLTIAGVPDYAREYQFHPERKWRFDFAWPAAMVAIEVEGSVHRIKSRFKGDLEKYAEAMLMGWKVLRVGNDQIKSGQAIEWLNRLIPKGKSHE